MGRLRSLGPVVASATALLAVGCGSTTTTTIPATTRPAATTTSTMPATTVTSAGPATTAPAGWSTEPVSVESRGPTALLVGVRAAGQDGFDRVTFEFANRVPGYAVQYVPRPVLQDGSGTEVEIDGAAVLAVQMKPASGFDLSVGGGQTYTGPRRITVGTSTLVEVVQVGDFEGMLTWDAGVSPKAGFKVSTLESPPRLVVDIKTG